MDYTRAFQGAMADAGLPILEPPVPDGQIHRFTPEGETSRSKHAWYVLYQDGIPAGAFGSWKMGFQDKWCAKPSKTLTEEEKIEYRRQINRARIAQEYARRHAHTEAMKRANEIWELAERAETDHPYLRSKQVSVYGLRMQEAKLIVPLRDSNGIIHSLQFINNDGQKRFLRDGAIQGHYFAIGNSTEQVYIVEGYATGATIHEATDCQVVVAFNAGNLLPVSKTIREQYPNCDITIVGDNDVWTEGNPGASKAREAAKAINAALILPEFADVTTGPTDFNDLAELEGLEAVRIQLKQSERCISSSIRVVDIHEFLALEMPPRENILTPWLPVQGLSMVFAPRGIGKTHFSLGVAYAVSCGGSFLGWEATKARGVLFIDGELPAVALQERLAQIVAASDKESRAPLNLITPDLQPCGMLDLSRTEDQCQLEPYLKDVSLIIVDNLSTLCRTGKENEAESWLPVQGWSLQMRSQGRSVLFVHHAGKGGAQRGTSRREDILDTVISLRRPSNYDPKSGAVFEVHFDKARGFHGEDAKPFEARLHTDERGLQAWATKTLDESTRDKVVALLKEGLSQKEIAAELEVHESTVSRHAKKAREQGLVQSEVA